jgi:hypothetical protein
VGGGGLRLSVCVCVCVFFFCAREEMFRGCGKLGNVNVFCMLSTVCVLMTNVFICG